jgi:predicted nucleic acid-binding protein
MAAVSAVIPLRSIYAGRRCSGGAERHCRDALAAGVVHLLEVQRDAILQRFTALPTITPARDDHVEAAEVRNVCGRKGVQLGTIDALLAQLAIRYELVLLTTDRDFVHAAAHVPLRVWSP